MTPPDDLTSRAKAAARRVAEPVLARVSDRATETLRAELDTARADVGALRRELDDTRRRLQADIELLRAELDARPR